MPRRTALADTSAPDLESEAWVRALRTPGPEREQAATDLHAMLLRAARFEIRRRGVAKAGSGETLEDLAVQGADDALSAILVKLDEFRFESRFTTWAYKFAIMEAAVLARRRAWQQRELPVDPQGWQSLPGRLPDPGEDVLMRERLRQVTHAIKTQLSPHQREVLLALVLADVPIDVLAERLNTTRGALYKTLHDARRKLRAAVEAPSDD